MPSTPSAHTLVLSGIFVDFLQDALQVLHIIVLEPVDCSAAQGHTLLDWESAQLQDQGPRMYSARVASVGSVAAR